MSYHHLRNITDEEWKLLKNGLIAYKNSDLDMRSLDDPELIKEHKSIDKMLEIMEKEIIHD